MRPFLPHQNDLTHSMPKEAAGTGSVLRKLIRAAVRRWQQHKLITSLHALDDRQLRDIGLYRNDIKRVVHGFDDVELGMVPLTPEHPPKGRAHGTFPKTA